MSSDAAFLDEITGAVRAELAPHRARGLPLKSVWPHVARRLGLTPRRARAYHNGEVKPDDVRANELARVREARRTAAQHQRNDANYTSELAELRDRLDRLEAFLRDAGSVALQRAA
jgi:hypothetical protein